MFQQGEGAPPQIFPPVPINEPGAPGSIAQPTTVPGLIVFEPTNPAPALASKTTVPLGPPTSVDPVFVPPIVLEVDPNTL
jgi:hypothetical protein